MTTAFFFLTPPDTSIPEQPRVFVDITYSEPAGSTIVVGDGGNFQAALNAAVPGDIITLNAGSTYTGNFTLPNNGGSSYIYIKSSAALTPVGARITPTQAASFPKIATSNSSPAIQTDAAARYYRFINIEFKSSSTAVTGGLIQLGTGSESSAVNFPRNIIIDRSYVHGDAANGGRRGVMFSGNYLAVIDSHISDYKEVGADTQAIAGWTGEGPWAVINNYLEAAGENMLVGGSDPAITNLVPSDIEVRGNTFKKPLVWNPSYVGYDSSSWSVKNIFELKNARRVSITGNILENNWVGGQDGTAILFTVRNQDGTAPWSTIEDITFSGNVLSGSARGINVLGTDNVNSSGIMKRVLVQNNVFVDIGVAPWGTNGLLMQLLGGAQDFVFNHNTAMQTGSIIFTEGTPFVRFKFTNNIVMHNDYGIIGTDYGFGNPTLAQYFPAAVVSRNVIVMNVADYSASYPTNNYYPTALATVDFINYPSSLTTSRTSVWELEEASGVRYDRVVTSANNLADVATVTQAAGKVGFAGQFTRINSEYLSKADNASLSTGNIDFAIAAWVYLDSKPVSSDSLTIVSKWDGTGNQREYELGWVEATDRFKFNVSTTGADAAGITASNAGSPSLAAWHFVVAWHDSVGNTINIRVNDISETPVAHSAGVFDSTGTFRIGACELGAGADRFMNGRIDQVGFWKRVLTGAEMTALHNATAGLSFAAMINYRLAATSPYISVATDGTYAGAPNSVISILP